MTIRAAVERGPPIDTAPAYGFGRSEEIVGKALMIEGWDIDEAITNDTNDILKHCIVNPVSSQFMAPPLPPAKTQFRHATCGVHEQRWNQPLPWPSNPPKCAA